MYVPASHATLIAASRSLVSNISNARMRRVLTCTFTADSEGGTLYISPLRELIASSSEAISASPPTFRTPTYSLSCPRTWEVSLLALPVIRVSNPVANGSSVPP